MPDITMCISEMCPRKHRCFRHEAQPKERWQFYSDRRLYGCRKLSGYKDYIPINSNSKK